MSPARPEPVERGQLLEIQIRPELLVEIRELLESEGMKLGVRSMANAYEVATETRRRRDESINLTAQILAILQRHAIQPLELGDNDIAEAGRRLELACNCTPKA